MARAREPGTHRRGVSIVPACEAALLVRLGHRIAPAIHRRVLRLLAALDETAPPGWRDLVPAYASVLVSYDPLAVDRASVETAIRRALDAAGDNARDGTDAAARGRVLHIGVRYGGEDGPDLAEVARMVGLTPDEVVRRHTGGHYRVYFLGFLAGFPYLGGLPTALAVGRLPTPRPRVPAGSVGIAGNQAGVYAVASPGGWRLIGRTPDALFDPGADPPALLRPGDQVRFFALAGDGGEEFTRRTQRIGDEEKGFAKRRGGREVGGGRNGEAEGGQRTSPRAPLPRGEESERTSPPSPQWGTPASLPWGEGRQVAALRVARAGPLATVQDLGRWGVARYGVSAAGAADTDALRLGNALVGNAPDAAGIEVTLGGAEFSVLAPCVIAVTGAACSARVNTRPVAMGVAVPLELGDSVALDTPRMGVRSYLCVAGGVGVPLVLGSRATDARAGLGGVEGRALRAGDVIHVGEPRTAPCARLWHQSPPDPVRVMPADAVWTLRVLPGPNAGAGRGRVLGGAGKGRPVLSEPVAGEPISDDLAALLAGTYVVDPRSDRVGVRVRWQGPEGAPRPVGGETISEGVPRGAVQIPPDGDPIVLLADHQATGGYRVPAVVIGADMWRVAQLRPGAAVRFAATTLEEAIAALRARVDWLAGVAAGVAETPLDAGEVDARVLARGFAEWSEEGEHGG